MMGLCRIMFYSLGSLKWYLYAEIDVWVNEKLKLYVHLMSWKLKEILIPYGKGSYLVLERLTNLLRKRWKNSEGKKVEKQQFLPKVESWHCKCCGAQCRTVYAKRQKLGTAALGLGLQMYWNAALCIKSFSNGKNQSWID